MDDIVERLREHATDWNGEQMPDLEPAKGDPTAGMLRHAADAIESLRAENAELREDVALWKREAAMMRPSPRSKEAPMRDKLDAETIAKGLSEAQRKAIVGAEDLMSSHGGYPFFTVEFTDPWEYPVAQFLTLHTDRLTPLGLAVRAILKGE